MRVPFSNREGYCWSPCRHFHSCGLITTFSMSIGHGLQRQPSGSLQSKPNSAFRTRVISFFGYFPPNCSSEGWRSCCGRDRRCPEFRLPGLTVRSGKFLKSKAGSLSAFLFRSAALSSCLRRPVQKRRPSPCAVPTFSGPLCNFCFTAFFDILWASYG